MAQGTCGMTTAPVTAFIYSERYQDFDYGPGHPLRNSRLALTHALCRAYGLLSLPTTRLIETRSATDAEVALFHRADYLDVLRAADRGHLSPHLWQYGLGTADNPVFSGVYEWNGEGGVVHWTHHDPDGSHTPGWLEHAGLRYQ